MKKLFGLFTLAIFSIALTMSSCTKEEVWTDAENYVFGAYDGLRKGPLGGHDRCYKVVFPVTLEFPDGTQIEVDDRAELIETIRDWKANNPDATERPTVVFPIEVVNKDGDTITVESKEEMMALAAECPGRRHGDRACRHFGNFLANKCFKVELPVSIVLPDGEIVTIEDRKDVAKLLREWKKNRPDEVPEIVFPITITLKDDNSTVEVNSIEELEAIIEECRG